MQKFTLAALAASLFVGASTVAADAHVSLERKEASPGSYKAVLGVPHGCDGKATEAVRVEIPEGFVNAKPMPKHGWTIEIQQGEYSRSYSLHDEAVSSGPVAVTWKGGTLADDHYDEFVLRGTLAGVEDGQRLFFKTTQTCASGAVGWTEEPEAGQDAHALEFPAPFLTVAAGQGDGHEHHGSDQVAAGDLQISAGWARAMLPGQPSGGAYMIIANGGDEDDRLVSVASPAAGKVEVHSMDMVDDVMVMRPVDGGLKIPAGESVELEPGGLHLMFMQVDQPFVEGAEVPVTLSFENAGEVRLQLPVLPARTGRGAHNH